MKDNWFIIVLIVFLLLSKCSIRITIPENDVSENDMVCKIADYKKGDFNE